MNAPKILSVQALENKKLRVKFVNGVEKIYDCAQLLSIEMFQLLKNDIFFKLVRVDAGGYGISWNDEVDLSEYELWTNGVDVVLFYARAPLTQGLTGILSSDVSLEDYRKHLDDKYDPK